MPVNSEIFIIYRHLFYGSPLKTNNFISFICPKGLYGKPFKISNTVPK